SALQERGIPVVKHRGRRVTTPEVRDVLVDVLARGLNGEIVERLRREGVPAIGFADGISAAVRCRRRPPTVEEGREVSWGEVGDIVRVEPAPLTRDGEGWSIPVLPSVG